MEIKNYGEAKACFEKDLAIRKSLDDKYANKSSHYSLSLSERHMGYVYEAFHDEEKALGYFKKCKEISKHTMSEPPTYREYYYDMVSTYDLAYCLKSLGRLKEAQPLYEQVLHFLELKEDRRPHEYVLDLESIKKEYAQVKEALK
jgi:tetratricopeptide (TPR) repeat protein